MSGKFIIDRDIFSNPIWQSPIEFRLFFLILGKAIWSEEGVRIGDITVKRGQYLRSYRNLRNDLMYLDNHAEKFYGITTIKRAVDKLIKDGRLEKEDTIHGTLFTVVNYKDYQRFERDNIEENKGTRNNDGTVVEQRWNNNKKDKKDKKEYNTSSDEKGNDYKSVYDYYLTLDLKKHRSYTNDMEKSIKKAIKDNNYSIEYCKILLDRHNTVVKLTKRKEKPVTVRGISEFFGQKAYNATHLICSEYEEGGKLYDNYLLKRETLIEPITEREIEYRNTI